MSQENTPATPEELASSIEELTQYRERLVTEMTDVAKKAKLKKSKLTNDLEPQLKSIDQMLEVLKSQYEATAS